MKKVSAPNLVPAEIIERHIHVVREHKVMLDRDLADLYGVDTRAINQALKRNPARFPQDFAFQLTWSEADTLKQRSYAKIMELGSNVKYLPYVFTEQGVAMLSSVLRSERAVAVNVEIMRVFVRMRQLMASDKELARRLDELETQVTRKFETYDQAIAGVFRTLRELMTPPQPPAKKFMGFVELEEKKK